jgi:hypothetical protein
MSGAVSRGLIPVFDASPAELVVMIFVVLTIGLLIRFLFGRRR